MQYMQYRPELVTAGEDESQVSLLDGGLGKPTQHSTAQHDDSQREIEEKS